MGWGLRQEDGIGLSIRKDPLGLSRALYRCCSGTIVAGCVGGEKRGLHQLGDKIGGQIDVNIKLK